MDQNIVIETLRDIVDSNADENGWMNLAHLGNELAKNGVDYKALGYYKLTNFISSYTNILEVRTDKTHRVPVYYVKLRKKPSQKGVKNVKPKNALTNWAYLKHYQTTIKNLKNKALEERWFYKKQNPDIPYPILTNYLHYTFYKLMREGNKILISENYASFNTGLVDNRYEPIYALFEKNIIYTQPWKLVEFCISGEGNAGKTLVRHFKDMPERAHYFSNSTDMLYDTREGAPEVDKKHIILENAGRLPLNLLIENPPKGFTLKNPNILPIDEKLEYYQNLAAAIEKDTKTYRTLTNRLNDAIELAMKRVQWNYKTAIPMYYPTRDRMSLLLPLSLVDDEVVDIALVVEKTKSGNYIGHTILPLDWAYSNARLVARPDSDWLMAEGIDTSSDEDEDEDI